MSMDPTALVVDDDDGVREYARDLLRSLGFTVLDVSSGAEALEAVARSPEPFDLLLTDFSMPEMNGTELARRVAGASPGTALLVMSGSPPRGIGRFDDLPLPAPCLSKQFTREDLAGMLERVLPATAPEFHDGPEPG